MDTINLIRSESKIPVKAGGQPLVSVIMPVYNAGEFLVEAIESILNQTYRNFEFFIVDDVSTDNSWEIIQDYSQKYPNIIKAIRLNQNTNAAGNGPVNAVLSQAQGEFIARMDADDIADPRRIEKQVMYMLSHLETIVLGTQAYVVDKFGNVVGQKIMPTTHARIYDEYGVFHPIVHPSVMINRQLLPDRKRIYEMIFDVNDDYYTFFKLLNYGKFANLPEFLLKYRVHGKNFSLNHPKAKFIDSVKIRFTAIRSLKYRMSIRAIILMLLQLFIVLPMPERLIVPIYLYIRGINQPLKNKTSLLPDFAESKKYAKL